jgi:16S rRNA (cytidine1402-2'-O)-methyltransferase
MSNLYIVSTTIGNLQDITIRAANILLNARIVIAESTSKAGILLDYLEKQFGTKRFADQKIISLTEDEEELKIPSLINQMLDEDAALISEAGTPLVSDPGFKLVRESIKRGINVISIPGASAVIAALTSSGLPTDKFTFLGYLPKKEGKRSESIRKLKEIKTNLGTIIIFESPHRINETLMGLKNEFGDMEIVIARELTKVHEELRREKISDSLSHFEKIAPRGEFVILF